MGAASPRAPFTTRNDVLAPFLGELDRYLADVDPLAIDRAHRLPAHMLSDLAELGIFGASIPETWGGSDLGLTGATAIVETLARRDRAVATTVGLHLGLGTRGLVAFGSAPQHERYLPDLASGKTLAAFAATEPSSGSDLARLATRAHRAEGHSDRLRIRGEKIYVTNGGLAQIYTVAVALELEDRHTRGLIILERSDNGLTVGREEDKLGLRGSSTTPLHLDTEVPFSRLIAPPADRVDPLTHVLSWGRTAMAAGCCGTAQAAIDHTLEHLRIRHQFGRPLATQPVIRAQVADMAATLLSMRALVAAAGTAELELDRERLSLSAKVFASDGDCEICDQALQLHGGAGYLEDTGIALLTRDARVTRIFEGANDVLTTRLGQLELTHPRDVLAEHPVSAVLSIQLSQAKKRGLAALRDPAMLHRLGRLAILRDAAWALTQLRPDSLASQAWQGPVPPVTARRSTPPAAPSPRTELTLGPSMNSLTPWVPTPSLALLEHADARLTDLARAHLVRRELESTHTVSRQLLDEDPT